tara:strand:- start:12083 stop:13075 length:993 start_codon:yes stop_codon:yes gene_type:complete
MVLFLDKKEQVIEFQLTNYGKHLFSQGKLDPKFYSFYDDDILYDSNYQTGTIDGSVTSPIFSEQQNAIVDRIKDTQRIGLTTDFIGFLTNNQIGEVSIGTLSNEFNQSNQGAQGNGPFTSDGEQQPRGNPIYMEKFQKPIGSNDPFKDFAPAWSVRSISGSKQLSGDYSYSIGGMPKLTASLDLQYLTRQEEAFDDESGEPVQRDVFSLIKNERLILDVEELNSVFKERGNFDIEVYKLSSGGDEKAEKLHFINDLSPAASDLKIQTDFYSFADQIFGTEEEIEDYFATLDSSYVEYYLSIRVDDEIDEPLPLGGSLYSTRRSTPPEDPC